jgi:ferrous iron transport protein A
MAKNRSKRGQRTGSPTSEISEMNNAIPLSALSTGEQGAVVQLQGGRGLLSRMASLGFTPGATITVLQNFGRGPLIVRVREARVALGRGEAAKIHVRR